MTDYPTRAEIDAAADTLARLRSRVGGPGVTHTLAWSALSDALAILDHLDDVPGLAPPEPEPKPTAAEVLNFAYACTESGTPEQGIMYAAKCYAEAHPAWFANWHERSPVSALIHAAHCARDAGNSIGHSALLTASVVATNHPELFGGAS